MNHVPEEIRLFGLTEQRREELLVKLHEWMDEMQNFPEFFLSDPPYSDRRLIFLGYAVQILYCLLEDDEVSYEAMQERIMQSEKRLYCTEMISAFLMIHDFVETGGKNVLGGIGFPSLN